MNRTYISIPLKTFDKPLNACGCLAQKTTSHLPRIMMFSHFFVNLSNQEAGMHWLLGLTSIAVLPSDQQIMQSQIRFVHLCLVTWSDGKTTVSRTGKFQVPMLLQIHDLIQILIFVLQGISHEYVGEQCLKKLKNLIPIFFLFK